MTDHPLCHHHIEWPAPGARLAGPGGGGGGGPGPKPGGVSPPGRPRTAAGVHLGVLGFPRADLARHFGARAAWLPAEFLLGVAAPDGELTIQLEAREASGEWVGLGTLACTVAPDGVAAPQAGGELRPGPHGPALERGPHQPFDGFLDRPETDAEARLGQVRVFGWLTHAAQPIRALHATLDGLSHRRLEHGLTDAALEKKFPGRPGVGTSRFTGWVDCPAELALPACLRLYAELADGSIHLCFARWIAPAPSPEPATAPGEPMNEGELPALPSGRPRRLLVVLRTLRETDSTGRALDVVRHLHAGGRWVARAVATEDGPARERFEAAGCPVQTIDVTAYFAQPDAARLADVQRQIWWRHLDAVAVFDPEQTWAIESAQCLHLPVFTDPAGTLPWAAEDAFAADPQCRTMLAPIDATAEHGIHILRQAVRLLETRHAEKWRGWTVIVPASTGKEFGDIPSLRGGEAPRAVAAVVCPAFARHPHRALLGAALAGVPVITTPGVALTRTFRAGELDVVPPNQPLALAHAMLALISLPAAARRRAEAARRIAAADHAAIPALHRWQRLLEGAAG